MTEQATEPTVLKVGHFTITEKPGGRVDVECGICKNGLETGPSFGPIPGEVLVVEFAKQHAHAPRKARKK